MNKTRSYINKKLITAFILMAFPAFAFAADTSTVLEMIRTARTVIYVIDGLVCTVFISYVAIMWKFGRKDIGDFVQVLAITVASGAAVALINWAWTAYATTSLGVS